MLSDQKIMPQMTDMQGFSHYVDESQFIRVKLLTAIMLLQYALKCQMEVFLEAALISLEEAKLASN